MVEEKKNIFAKSSFILSIISVIIAFVPLINQLCIVIGILSIFLGVISMLQKGTKSIAITSIFLSIVSIYFAYYIINYKTDLILDTIGKTATELNTRIYSENNNNNTQEVLQNEVEVTLGDFQEIVTTYETDTFSQGLPVTLRNKSTTLKSFNITIEAVDEDGNRITEDTVYIQNLGSGQSYKTNAFNYTYGEIAEQLQNATFRVLEASSF